ncbi:hypothetical protein ACI78T_17340 [Blastococcus sp. SYSU D00922]
MTDTAEPRPALRHTLVLPAESDRSEPAGRVTVPDGWVLRAAPLLEVADVGEHLLVAVGQTQVRVHGNGDADLVVVVRALWQATARSMPRRQGEMGFRAAVDWTPVSDHSGIAGVVDGLVARLPGIAGEGADATATQLAKALAETSRNAVSALRRLRYSMERRLAAEIRDGTKSVESALADILELSTAAGRARDEARAARREGLWSWRSDDAAYQAQRRLLDPSLPERTTDVEGRSRPWFLTLDAGVRQCVQMDDQLAEETAVLHGLLTAASTIAVTRDARAQENLTLIAAVGGILLGLPGLVLALYGASTVLPLSGKNSKFVVPLIVAGGLAIVIAALLPGHGRVRAKRIFGTVLSVVVTTLLLMWAGGLVPPS